MNLDFTPTFQLFKESFLTWDPRGAAPLQLVTGMRATPGLFVSEQGSL